MIMNDPDELADPIPPGGGDANLLNATSPPISPLMFLEELGDPFLEQEEEDEDSDIVGVGGDADPWASDDEESILPTLSELKVASLYVLHCTVVLSAYVAACEFHDVIQVSFDDDADVVWEFRWDESTQESRSKFIIASGIFAVASAALMIRRALS